MTTIKLNQYGAVLTGREFGKTVLTSIIDKHTLPIALDFEGVFSMGSSFGDEVLPHIARMQENTLRISNASKTVISCIAEIERETGLKFTYS